MVGSLSLGLGLTGVAALQKGGWYAGLDDWYDFELARSKYADYNGLTDTWSGGYVPNAAGVYVPKAANELALTDLGLLTQPTRTNYVPRFAYNSGSWGIGRATLEGGYADPIGGNGAARMTMSGGTDPIVSVVTTTTGALGSRTFTGSVWLRLVDAKGHAPTASLYMYGASGAEQASYSPMATITSQWQRFSFTKTFSSATSSAVEFRVDPFDGSGGTNTPTAGAQIEVFGFQLEEGPFATEPIITTGSAVTRTGNRQVIDLTGKLNYGVAGFVKVDLRGAGSFKNLLYISDGSGTNRVSLNASGDGAFTRLDATSGGALQGAVSVGSTLIAQQTIAFALGTNFLLARRVGDAIPSADTSVTLPVGMNQLSVGGSGFNSDANTYQTTKKLGLIFGTPDRPINQALFDQVYAQAVAA